MEKVEVEEEEEGACGEAPRVYLGHRRLHPRCSASSSFPLSPSPRIVHPLTTTSSGGGTVCFHTPPTPTPPPRPPRPDANGCP